MKNKMDIIHTIFAFIAIGCLVFISYHALKELEESRQVNKNIYNQLNIIQTNIIELKTILESDNQIVMVTAYHPKSRGLNSDSNPNRTATMKKPVAGYTCAISDELFHLGWLGKKIYLYGYGVWKAEDKMASSVKGKRIDLCVPSLKHAKRFGIKKNVRAIILN